MTNEHSESRALRIDSSIDAIAAEVRTRIPSLKQFAAIGDPGDMGPDVTIPAIWMALLLSRIDGLKATLKLRDTEARCSVPYTPKPVTDDAIAEYAASLARHAAGTLNDPLEGASVMFQGGVAALMTVLPPSAVLVVVEGLPEIFDLQSKLGVGAVLQ